MVKKKKLFIMALILAFVFLCGVIVYAVGSDVRAAEQATESCCGDSACCPDGSSDLECCE